MRILLSALLFSPLMLLADDQVRDVQVELKNQGFYYGAVDGKGGQETSAAIRRFQIRNGLKVTGEVNEETLGALGIGAPAPTAKTPPVERIPEAPGRVPKETTVPKEPQPPMENVPRQVNPPAPGEERRVPARPPMEAEPPRAKDLLRERELEQGRPVRPRVPVEDPNIVPPPRAIPTPVQDDWATFFHGTPYSSAPREVQIDILLKAQEIMARARLYRARLDGAPGPETSEALFLYQEQRRLIRTGRLDLSTLSAMNLLPGRGPDAPPLKPFYNPNRKRDYSVDQRGLIR